MSKTIWFVIASMIFMFGFVIGSSIQRIETFWFLSGRSSISKMDGHYERIITALLKEKKVSVEEFNKLGILNLNWTNRLDNDVYVGGAGPLSWRVQTSRGYVVKVEFHES